MNKFLMIICVIIASSCLLVLLMYLGFTKKIKGDPITELHSAVLRNDIELVQKLINEGFDVNSNADLYSGGYDQLTPLCLAAENGSMDIIELLIDAGADINKSSPLFYAANEHHWDLVEFFLEKGANPNYMRWNQTPLSLAAGNSQINLAKKLIESGADISYDRVIWNVIGSGSLELIKYLEEKGASYENDKIVPCKAAASGSMPVVKYLFDKGIDFNQAYSTGDTPFFQAVENGHIEVVVFLIETTLFRGVIIFLT